ncbi:VOC family protein [Kineosporia succinea]
MIDSADPAALARWWGEALGWTVSYEDVNESDLTPAPGEPGLELTFVPVPEAKNGWNRLHLDLASRDAAHQAETVARLEQAGATRVDIGVERPWVVLADPEGNEFCVLEHRDEYDNRGPVAAVVAFAHDPAALGSFWQQAAGGELEAPDGPTATIELTTPGPLLEFIRSEAPKTVKNRLHLDVRPYADDDQAAEVSRLVNLGALRTDVGQEQAAPGEVTWTVLTDPEGNEFCVLRPRA